MKKLLIMMVAFAAVFCGYAQKHANPNTQTIDASQVPDSVKNSQNVNFKLTTVTRWEMHSGKKGPQYIAEFMDPTGLRNRVRYDGVGHIVLITKFYRPNQLPQSVATASKRYPGYSITMVEELTSTKKNKSWFSVRMKSPSGKKVVLLDENGNEIAPDKVPEEAQPEPLTPPGNE